MKIQAQTTYDRFAPIYDEWNAQNDYEMWLGETLLPELARHGLQKGWALDVGCGTGRAFPPLLDRGWRVIGCDLSAGMLAQARRKFESRVRLIETDARNIPPIAPTPQDPPGAAFQLILLLNDVVNYLLEAEELEELFDSVKSNLGHDQGLFVFDANALRLYREDYLLGVKEVRGDRGWEWRGLTREIRSEGRFEAGLFGCDIEAQVHRQRHWTPKEVQKALQAAGLRVLAVLGQREEAGRIVLEDPPDEDRDRKLLYIVGHSA